MTFARITKMGLFDELHRRFAKGLRCPSLGWIAKFSKLADDDQAEALLWDMKRDGNISVLRMGPYPWIALCRQRYGGPIVTEMTLDPERFDQFADSTDVLVVRTAPDPATLPSARVDDDIEELVAAVEERVARVPVKRIQMPKRPEVETVEAQQGGHPDGNSRPASVDHGPRLAKGAARSPRDDDSAVEASSQPVEARQPDPLLAEIEAFLTKHSMAPTTFGKRALTQSLFVEKLRHGLQPQGKTIDRVRRYIADYQPPAPRLTFKCGHPRTPENSIGNGHGYKRCAQCGNAMSREWKRAKKAAVVVPVIGRPHVRAAVLRQWEAEGRPPLNAFLTDLLDLGLEARTAFRRAA